MESKIVRIKNNTDCRRRVEYLHRAYNVLLDPEREAKRESQPVEGGQRCASLTLSSRSLSVSTRTSRDEPTLRISRPSSASSRLSNRCSFCSSASGLSPSSIVPPTKSGFRSALRNASAMIAASAPENGVSVEWE